MKLQLNRLWPLWFLIAIYAFCALVLPFILDQHAKEVAGHNQYIQTWKAGQ